jgi:glycosyltransferase involved in cell wall biosynthesis
LEKQRASLEVSDDIKFLGYREDALQILEQADVFVLTSDVEGLPGVILEAMVRKIPVISSNAGGISEVITHNLTGFLCNDSESFLFFMHEMTENEDLREKISKNAYKKVADDFSLDSVSERFFDLYNHLLKS